MAHTNGGHPALRAGLSGRPVPTSVADGVALHFMLVLHLKEEAQCENLLRGYQQPLDDKQSFILHP
ncbi:MAG: hypothetical protein AAB699_01010 [Patescibacteria group bacterium]